MCERLLTFIVKPFLVSALVVATVNAKLRCVTLCRGFETNDKWVRIASREHAKNQPRL